MFEEFLNDVVAKDVRHQLYRVWLDLSEDLVFLVAICGLELLLDEPRPMLVAAKLDDVVVYVLQMVR